MSKYLFIFDPGHGGLINGKYVTPGKRSPKFDNGSVLYEGVNNREIVKRLLTVCKSEGIDALDITNGSNDDVSLSKRVSKANSLHREKSSIYISIHSDAAGDGISWHQASGISVYTSPGQTKSDIFASLVIDELERNFGSTVRWRKDTTDSDEDKEENFYVLKETIMPAILGEFGFHTNKEEATKMLTDEWKGKVVNSIVSAIRQWEKL